MSEHSSERIDGSQIIEHAARYRRQFGDVALAMAVLRYSRPAKEVEDDPPLRRPNVVQPSVDLMRSLGEDLAQAEGVQFWVDKRGILVSDEWHAEPLTLETYFSLLGSSSPDIIVSPSPQMREVLAISIGRSLTPNTVLPEFGIQQANGIPEAHVG
jgi:hypothetical protein